MNDNQEKINQLLRKLDTLLRKHETFAKEIHNLRIEIEALKSDGEVDKIQKDKQEKPVIVANENVEISAKILTADTKKPLQDGQPEASKKKTSRIRKSPKVKSDLEKFVGENLINKIGIAITIIGVAIGARYSIQNDLISPLTRIILGYFMGIGLLGFGMKLKKKYENYSAVLVSGAMTILYFITYFAYSFYDLIPQVIAFALMVVFTAFTVLAAINYNRQIIAHIGLVGAYAVPFLLSSGSGKVEILFSYISIINIGILIIAFKKYWKPLYYSAFGLTWLLYLFWFGLEYKTEEHFALGLTFLFIFFVIFYLTFLAYKLLQKQKFNVGDIILLLANSFIFYGIGFVILDGHTVGEQLLGVFTLCNAIIHFIVSGIIYRQKLADRNLLYLASGLVLVFITITIPVQLDGNWVTLLWTGQAALLFWVGRTKNIPVYEKLSYLLMILAFVSLVQDWSITYDSYYPEHPESWITPILNINFLSSVLCIIAFSFINIVNLNKNYANPLITGKGIWKIFYVILPALLIFIIYYAFRIEIENYWYQLYEDSVVTIDTEGRGYSNTHWNFDLNDFRIIWVINYSLLFVSLLTFFNFIKIKSKALAVTNLVLTLLTILVFLTQGLYTISELRDSYLEQNLAEYYQIGLYNINIRYISFAFVALALFASYKNIRQKFVQNNLEVFFDFFLQIAILWIASSEIIHWMDMGDSTQSYKLGLSILWGIYALFLIILGIWKKKKHLRIGAIILFAITLIKLFFYDISHLDTIAKTIVFVSLGILLLIISFLYNKYKHIISDEGTD